MNQASIKRTAIKEFALLSVLLFLGFVVMPFLIYKVGQVVFGTYQGVGYSEFFGTLSEKVRSWDLVAWFLVMSPWLGWQCLRLTSFAWRKAASKA